jgi:hypothetical protein
MIAACTERRGLMDRLLLDGMAWTNANTWFGVAGLAATLALGCCLDGLLK